MTHLNLLLGTASLSLIFLPSLAHAQLNDEIIVTATKTEQSVQDLGMSISVIDGAKLERFDGAEELSQSVAGLQAAVANGSQIAFQIRGIGAVDHQALTPTAAAVYVDGIFQATNVQTSPLLFDLERVEVLKGPQGSLYGRNATAGAINFISTRPNDEREGYVSAQIGTFERVNLNAAANMPISDDFALRLSGRYLSQGPMIDNVVTSEGVAAPQDAGGVRDEFGLRAVGLYSPSDNTDVLFNLHYAEDNGTNASPLNASLDLSDHEISVGPSGVQDTDNEFYGASLEISHDFGSFDLVSLTGFEGYNQQYGFDFGALQDFSVLVASFSGSANLSYDRDFSQISQEFRVSRKGKRYSSMVGLYLEAEDFDQDYRVWCGELNTQTLVGSCNYIAAARRVGSAPASAADANSLQSLISQTRESAALFTYNEYDLTPNLGLVLGARLNSERIEAQGEGRHYFSDGVMGINDEGDIGAAIGSNTISDTRLTGNVGLNYKPNDDTLIYASLSNGFKSGGFNGEVIVNASHFDDAGLFDAETVTTAELGLKRNGADYSFNIAGFYNDYDAPQARFFEDVTLEDGQSISLNSLSNFQSAISYGLELDAQYSPVDALNLYAGMTLQKSEIEDDSVSLNNVLVLDGDSLPFASDLSLVIGGDYSAKVSDHGWLDVGVSAKHQSDFVAGIDGEERGAIVSAYQQPAYDVIDAQASLTIYDRHEIGIWARNLSDTDYAVSAYRFFGDTTFRGAPRTYGVSLKYSY